MVAVFVAIGSISDSVSVFTPISMLEAWSVAVSL